MDVVETDTLTLSMSAPGHQTTADASPYKKSQSSGEQDLQSPGNSLQSNTSSTSLSMQCYTPGSSAYLKLEAHPSTSHLLQIRLMEVDQDPRIPGIRSGRLVTKLCVPISQQANLLPLQVLMQAAMQMLIKELPSASSQNEDPRIQQ